MYIQAIDSSLDQISHAHSDTHCGVDDQENISKDMYANGREAHAEKDKGATGEIHHPMETKR